MDKHLLLAEDDEDFRNILRQYLEVFGYRVDVQPDGEAALAAVKSQTYDLCILDVMMPKLNGFELAERIIELQPDTPFIFLTARKMKADKLKGLRLGADDYIVKPFEADELVLRLNNILRRHERSNPVTNDTSAISIGNYVFDATRHELHLDDQLQKLTKKETALIHYLHENRNVLIKRETLLTAVWGSDDFFSGRSMDVFISRLRKYFSGDPAITLQSTRGVGLEFRVDG